MHVAQYAEQQAQKNAIVAGELADTAEVRVREAIEAAVKEFAINVELIHSFANQAERIKTLIVAACPSWSAGQVYSYPDIVCWIDGHTYRCTGLEITEPPPSENWVCITYIAKGNT